MSRYSIEGQILTDIGDSLRNHKYGDWLLEVNVPNAKDGITRQYSIDYPGRIKITIDNIVIAEEVYGSNKIKFVDIPVNGGAEIATVKCEDGFPQTVYSDNNAFNMYISGFNGSFDLRVEPADDVSFKPEDMALEINNLPVIPSKDLVVTGDCIRRFANIGWNWFLKLKDVTSNDITNCAYMFENNSTITNIPFDLNLLGSSSMSMGNMFSGCKYLKSIPMINISLNQPGIYFSEMFRDCNRLTDFPEGFAENWDWTKIETATSIYDGRQNGMFQNCYSLRRVPQPFISHCNRSVNYSYGINYNIFNSCYNLEKINGITVPYKASWTSNSFNNTVQKCERLRDFTFETQEDGTPFVASSWKKQTIDFTTVGFGISAKNYNTALTADTKITDAASYANIDNNPDYWAESADWAVYNRKSAVRTINTLPDVSASNGGNVIKFKSAAASAAGEEYAMANLSEEEIAVAAAKGWTVTLA